MSALPPLVSRNPFDGSELGSVRQLGEADAAIVLDTAREGARIAALLPRHERAGVLEEAAGRLERQAERFANLIVAEAGKTIRQAGKEVQRAAHTLRLSAVEARRNAGEVIPFDAYPGSERRRGWFTREPLGVILAITPYNDALNLVAHKLGPAIAGGNAVILKPSQLTPLVARALVELLVASGLPERVVTVVHGGRELARGLISARDVRMVSFTGGFATGEAIAASAGLKRLAMELGGNAPVLVFEDADLDRAVEACVSGAFWAAGQNCIGVQRILVQRSRYAEFEAAFANRAARLVAGDPRSSETDVGPMIDHASAERALARVEAAMAGGARVLAGGRLEGSVLSPTVLAGADRACELWAEEAFAPVVLLEPFDDEREAVARANAVEYALHAAVFTRDVDRALRVASSIEAGGVMINDSSDYRFDGMPFGGAKYGGMGREGVRFAYEEMTQPKVVAILS